MFPYGHASQLQTDIFIQQIGRRLFEWILGRYHKPQFVQPFIPAKAFGQLHVSPVDRIERPPVDARFRHALSWGLCWKWGFRWRFRCHHT